VAQVGTLPTSRRAVVVREPVGEDELLALQGAGTPTETALALAARLVEGVDDWLELPAVDLAAAVLLVRRAWLARSIRTEARCADAACREQVDIDFEIDAYLEHHRPRACRGAVQREPGVYELAGTRFRIPPVRDLLDGSLDRCVDGDAPPDVMRRIERALESLAPPLAGTLAGECPVCGARVELWFEPIEYVLQELRDSSLGLVGEVHELALAYHWSEPAILGLDRARRRDYVELVREALVA
jgi:hypothetical protein